ncbi:MAG: metal-dependent transcriptional regulator, partial [Candidatus Margulisbacteria bacterium]|nr:metal-dependent transcriptional regulator [Candidatus Margulisiibacteriota bacterium]
MKKKLTANMENYLETVFVLQREHGHAHVKDIAKTISIKMPSVTEALRKLKRSSLVNYDRYNSVTLTQKGKGIAQKVMGRHQVLYKFLHGILKIESGIAEKDACRIEHVISRQTLKKIKRF